MCLFVCVCVRLCVFGCSGVWLRGWLVVLVVCLFVGRFACLCGGLFVCLLDWLFDWLLVCLFVFVGVGV